MYGFTVINGKTDVDFQDFLYQKSFKFQASPENFYFFGYSYFSKFENDKIFEEDQYYIIGLDGVILNLQKLKNSYGISDYFTLVVTLFKKYGIHFVAQLKGEFNGFIFDKNSSKLFFFNNKTATKQIFYASFKQYHIISQCIASIISFKEKQNETSSLQISAVYSLLTFGAMIESETLVNGVTKLGAGKYLTLNKLKIKEKEYFSFNNIPLTISSKKEAINRIDETITEAIKLEFQKDVAYNYKHIATLSGGLDSRVNVMIAHKMGYKSTTFCFSEPDYLDEVIAKKIAKSLDLEHQFISLNNGSYMKDVAENCSIANGTQIFTGAAHYNFALQQLDLSNYGLMHTGQIGDGILGGLLSKGKNNNFLSKTMSSMFLDKVKVDSTLLSKYKNEEVFKLYQRVFNLTHSGSFTTEYHKTYLVSPFLDDDVILTALSIDPKLKYNQHIYIDWICEKHPELTKFVWERTGFKPNKKWKTTFSRFTKKIKNEYLKLSNNYDKLSMAPEDFWIENNQIIKEFYSNYFHKHISLLKNNTALYNDVSKYYFTGKSTEKAIVLSLLEMVKKFELNV